MKVSFCDKNQRNLIINSVKVNDADVPNGRFAKA